MKRKLIVVLTISALAAMMLLTLSACLFDHEHKWEVSEHQDPTCTEDGYDILKCYCGEQKTKTISRLGHAWKIIDHENPSCTAEGCDYRECSRCGAYDEVVLPTLPHQIISDNGGGKEPTCTEDGYTSSGKCSVCQNYIPSETIPKLGHDYQEGVCSRCGDKEQYAVVYHAQDNADTTKYYTYGDHFESIEPSILPENRLFNGWYNEDGTQLFDENTVITGNTDVYAHWLENYAVATAEQLFAIKDKPDVNYYLTANINLQGAKWTPIENFSGVLDGQNHRIYNFSVTDSAAGNNYAMFVTNDGEIRDLEIRDATYNVTSDNNAETRFGVFAATNNGVISGCTFSSGTMQYKINMASTSQPFQFGVFAAVNKGTVSDCACTVDLSCETSVKYGGGSNTGGTSYNSTNLYTGGIVGRNEGEVSDCHYDGEITMTSESDGSIYATMWGAWTYYYQTTGFYFGGVIGIQSGGTLTSSYSNFNFTHSKSVTYFYGGERARVDSQNDYVGGLVGINTDNGQITYCYANGLLNDKTIDSSTVGGLAAVNDNNSAISSCYSTADVVAVARYNDEIIGVATAGGLVGQNSATVQDSYAIGEVRGGANSTAGGFIGNNTSTGNISKSYSTGNVYVDSGTADFFVGKHDGTIYKCYYLQGATVQTGGVYRNEAANGTPQPYSVLWTEDFLRDELYWDESGWIIPVNEDPILSWEKTVGHNYETKVVKPTCTDFGYTVYTCRDCDRIFISDYVAPTGHDYDYDNPQTVPATCTEEGHTYYRCKNEGCEYLHEVGEPTPAKGHQKSSQISKSEAECGKAGEIVYHCNVCQTDFTEEIPALQHQPEIKPGDERVEPTCKFENGEYVGTPGRTAKVTCSVCGETLEEPQTIEPHEFTRDEHQSVKPDCTNEGRDHLTCIHCGYTTDVTVPATGHTVTQGTARCAVCGQYVVNEDTITKISNLDGLKAIANNLGGIYMLTADIDLLGQQWTPIGNAANPFTGMLFGNGRKIKNLAVGDLTDGGLFGCNEGEIVGVTVENATLSFANADNVLLGVIAAVNKGKIVECTVSGSVVFNVNASRVTDTFDKNAYSCYVTLGGVAAENIATGIISNCTVSATINVTLLNEFKNTASVDWTFYLLRGWKQETAVSATSLTFGGVVGRNSGTVEKCTVGDVKITVTQNIYIERTTNKAILGEVKYKAGKMEIVANVYAAALVGYNSGTVTDSKARSCTVSNLGGTQDDSSSFFSMKHTFNNVRNTDASISELVAYSEENAHCDNLTVLS